MSTVDVVFTRTFDGDYMADFSCNDSDLPHDTAVFCRTMIDDTELAALRAQAAEAETLRAERDKWADMFNDECLIVTQLRATIAEQARQLEQARVAIEAAMDYLESLEYSGHCYQLLLNWYSGSFAANARYYRRAGVWTRATQCASSSG